jgi:RNA recognition motif-containing protein
MNNKKKNKKATISVKQSKEKANISSSISKTNVYIKGLNENITDNDLFEMCSKYGEIKVNLVDFENFT